MKIIISHTRAHILTDTQKALEATRGTLLLSIENITMQSIMYN